MNRTSEQNDRPHGQVTIVVVEDETWIRENLVREINHAPGFRCINDYRTAEAALEGIPKEGPDVVLMDINLPGMDGVECVRRLRASSPELKFLMLTVYEESEKIFKSLLAGANGYMLKRTSTPNLLEAIRQTYSGGAPMSSSIARKVVAYFNEMGKAQSNTVALSPRELQVLELLANGAAYKHIADKLSLSIETIRMNVKHIYTKLHVHSRGEAVAKYMQKTGTSKLPVGN
ncbi:MAG TPA: response regulator transcription factor [Verrucomicrobiae bacterium]|jgi:DNA-binding NarL/FixJ family response regulator|nr:response regulator transcription factor [Verrucomicrobiae bacterium]HEX4264161.1 response regulator transcription factor [Verrucomicrobiae bacterium]